jgi:hypothetical protein
MVANPLRKSGLTMPRETLLPQNRTTFEEAADLTGARISDLPLHVPKLVRPYEAPAPFLPWVAWGLSVDFWEKDWPEDKHRLMLARSLGMHARKGTATAIAEAVKIMGGDLRRFIVPPAKTSRLPSRKANGRPTWHYFRSCASIPSSLVAGRDPLAASCR